MRPSPWRLDDPDLIAEWFDGWVAAACEQEPALAVERRTGSGAWRRRRPASCASPSTMPTCWCCHEVGQPRRRRRDARRPGLAARHGPVPRRAARSRRRSAGGRGRPGGADHRVLRVALEDRGPRPRRRPAARHRGGRVLPLDLPQRHAARRDRRRRPPRDQPRAAGRRVGAGGRAGRADRADRRRAARRRVARASGDAVRRARAGAPSRWRLAAGWSSREPGRSSRSRRRWSSRAMRRRS